MVTGVGAYLIESGANGGLLECLSCEFSNLPIIQEIVNEIIQLLMEAVVLSVLSAGLDAAGLAVGLAARIAALMSKLTKAINKANRGKKARKKRKSKKKKRCACQSIIQGFRRAGSTTANNSKNCLPVLYRDNSSNIRPLKTKKLL